MSEYQPPASTVLDWLRSNLGSRALAPLTGTDTKMLRAAVQIIEAWGYHRVPQLLQAFAFVVAQMQTKTQWLAYHAIAHPLDWSDRDRVWNMAGLNPKILIAVKCSFEPGGTYVDLAEKEAQEVES